MVIVDEVRKKVRCAKFVSVKTVGVADVKISSARSNLFGWDDFDFDTLFEIVNMDLSNAFFTVGDVLLKQIKGIAMGSPLSPILAILVCAYYENTFFRACDDDERDRVDG